MTERSIAEALFIEADEAEHDDYFDRAVKMRNAYLDHRPRIDTREDLIYLIQNMDELYEACCREAGRTLRKLKIDTEDHWLLLTVDPFTGPFPWEAG